MFRNLSWNPRRLFEPQTEGGAGGGGTAAQTPPATQQQQAPPAANPQAANPPPGVDPQQWQAMAQPLLDRISQTIDSRIAPIRETQANLQGRIDQLSQPVTNAQGLVQRAPGQIRGQLPSEAERHGYQMWRVYGLQHKSPYMSPDKAKYELSIHQKLYDAYVEQGGMMLGGDNSVLVPFGVNMLIDDGIREEVRQSLYDGVRGADSDEIAWILQQSGMGRSRQALSFYDDSRLGVFTHGGPMGEMIELVRKREVFSRVGASQVTLPPNGRLPYPKQTGAGTAYWVGENAQITSSEQTTGTINLIAKKLAALTKLPNELVRFGNPSVEAFIRNDLSRVMSLEADLAMLEGVGSTTKVKGLITYSGINTHTASTTAANGDTLEPEDGRLAIAEIEDDNHDTMGLTWVMRARMWTNILNRRTGGSTTGDGPWLFPVNRNDITAGRPMMWDGHPVALSNQVSNTRVKASGTDLTYILGGVFEHFLIGRVGVLEFATSTSGDTAFQNDQTWLRCIQHMDAAPRYEDAFVLIDDLDMDLPA